MIDGEPAPSIVPADDNTLRKRFIKLQQGRPVFETPAPVNPAYKQPRPVAAAAAQPHQRFEPRHQPQPRPFPMSAGIPAQPVDARRRGSDLNSPARSGRGLEGGAGRPRSAAIQEVHSQPVLAQGRSGMDRDPPRDRRLSKERGAVPRGSPGPDALAGRLRERSPGRGPQMSRGERNRASGSRGPGHQHAQASAAGASRKISAPPPRTEHDLEALAAELSEMGSKASPPPPVPPVRGESMAKSVEGGGGGGESVPASSPPRPYDDSTLQGPNKPLPPTPTDQSPEEPPEDGTLMGRGKGRQGKRHSAALEKAASVPAALLAGDDDSVLILSSDSSPEGSPTPGSLRAGGHSKVPFFSCPAPDGGDGAGGRGESRGAAGPAAPGPDAAHGARQHRPRRLRRGGQLALPVPIDNNPIPSTPSQIMTLSGSNVSQSHRYNFLFALL